MSFENKYPYTDFHELNLDWFLAEFKKTMDDNLRFKEDMTEKYATMKGIVDEFTDFVTNYFDNLDVQEEINHKLDVMAEDGSLSALIQPLFDEYKETIDGIVSIQNEDIAEQDNRIITLEGRMDAFASLTEGSTTGDAELMDIRVGANGITYASAGDAVRGQFSEIEDRFDTVRTNQLIDENDPAIIHGTVNSSNILISSANSILYIPVESGKDYCVSRTQKIGRFIVYLFTDEPEINDTAATKFATSTDYGTGDYITVSKSLISAYSATYLAVYFRNNVNDSAYTEAQLIANLMIEVGTLPTGWMPYTVKKLKNVNIYLDDELDENSGNAVKNSVISSALNGTILDVSDLHDKVYMDTLWTEDDFEDGTISTTTGANVNSDYRIRMKERYVVPFDMTVTNSTGYNLNIFTYAEGTVTNTGYPDDDVIREYNLTKGDVVRIVISRYPLSMDTNPDDYDALKLKDVTQFDNINYEIDELDKAVNYTSKVNEVKNSAEFFETEDITYLTTKYYVGEDYDYASIGDALTAWASDSYPPACVFIQNGEYNETVFVEDHTIAFIGESKEGTIIRTKTGDYSLPPFKIHHGNVLVANITAIADHTGDPDFAYVPGSAMAYAFHIDGGSVGGQVIIRNCNAVSYQSPAFGMGLIPDSTIRLEDVDAYTYTDDTADAATSLSLGCILCHMADNTLYPNPGTQTLELVNVRAYMKNSKLVVDLEQGDSPASMQITAINLITADGENGTGNENVKLPTYYDLNTLNAGNNADKLNQ